MFRKFFILSIILPAISLILSACDLNTLFSEPTATATLQPTPTNLPDYTIGSTQTSPIDGMEMVYVPAGDFLMGSIDETAGNGYEFPQHTVYLDAFWIDKTEVTFDMYQKCVTAGVCAEVSEDAILYFGELGDLSDYPVTDIDWFEADIYCRWAGRSLPTEAQWEKAARGIDGQTYPWGEETPAGNLANFADVNATIGDWVDTSVDDGYMDIAPVGSYPDGASPYGALDMAGNVTEWVSDWEGVYPAGNVSNPHGPSSGENRVFRGGSWFEEADRLRAAYRGGSFPIYGFSASGFRCALNNG